MYILIIIRNKNGTLTTMYIKNKDKSIIKLDDVAFRYNDGNVIFQDINLSIEEGSFHFLTGKSGAGKSSFLKLLYLESLPTTGDAYIFEKNTKSYTRVQSALARQDISVVFQDCRLLPHLNTFDNVALPLRIKGHSEESIGKKVEELLSWVGLHNFINAFPQTLSGGQQQRVSIARSVITQPRIILADEPTGSVDDTTASRIMNLFEQLHRHGTTIIMATHNRTLVEEKKYSELIIENSTIKKRKNHDI